MGPVCKSIQACGEKQEGRGRKKKKYGENTVYVESSRVKKEIAQSKKDSQRASPPALVQDAKELQRKY